MFFFIKHFFDRTSNHRGAFSVQIFKRPYAIGNYGGGLPPLPCSFVAPHGTVAKAILWGLYNKTGLPTRLVCSVPYLSRQKLFSMSYNFFTALPYSFNCPLPEGGLEAIAF